MLLLKYMMKLWVNLLKAYKFLEKFNSSGRADLLKEKLKKFIVRIVRDKFGKKKTPIKDVFKDERDQFYSELYGYLTDTLKKQQRNLLN